MCVWQREVGVAQCLVKLYGEGGGGGSFEVEYVLIARLCKRC